MNKTTHPRYTVVSGLNCFYLKLGDTYIAKTLCDSREDEEGITAICTKLNEPAPKFWLSKIIPRFIYNLFVTVDHPDDEWKYMGTASSTDGKVMVTAYVNHYRKKAVLKGGLYDCAVDYNALKDNGKIVKLEPFISC